MHWPNIETYNSSVEETALEEFQIAMSLSCNLSPSSDAKHYRSHSKGGSGPLQATRLLMALPTKAQNSRVMLLIKGRRASCERRLSWEPVTKYSSSSSVHLASLNTLSPHQPEATEHTCSACTVRRFWDESGGITEAASLLCDCCNHFNLCRRVIRRSTSPACRISSPYGIYSTSFLNFALAYSSPLFCVFV